MQMPTLQMRRVVVTGMGVVSSLGNNQSEVLASLRDGRSGITHQPEYAERGLRSHVAGSIKNLDIASLIDRKLLRFMASGHAYAWIAMQEAISDAALPSELVSNIRTGLIVGAGGTSTQSMLEATDILREKGIRRVGPYAVTKTMSSGVAACLATGAEIKGINYGISSACSTSAHCIGAGVEQIQMGKQDIVFAGGAEEEHWTMSFMFDAMGAMSSKYNDTPEKASRTYDIDRDGFVISGGGGILVLEELEHAKARGAKIYAEIIGYGATSDGYDMVAPSGKARYVVCNWPCRVSMSLSTTSIHMAPARRWGIARSWKLFQRYLVMRARWQSLRRNLCRGMRWALQASTRQFIAC